MGSGASSLDTSKLPDKCSEDILRELLGDSFNAQAKTAFDQASEASVFGDLFVFRADFLRALRDQSGHEAVDSPLVLAEKARSEEDRALLSANFLAAVGTREKRLKVKNDEAAKLAGADYSKGFSGTAADTKAEKDFAKLALGDGGSGEGGDDGASPEEMLALAQVDGITDYDLEELRKLGKWTKLLGGSDCWIYVHPVSRETVTKKPEGFVDEDEEESASTQTDYGGIPSVSMELVLPEIERIVNELKKTPLLLDSSFDRKLATFFAYKGVLVDATKVRS